MVTTAWTSKRVRTVLVLFFTISPVLAKNVTFVWDPSPDTSVTGYILYYGNFSGNYSESINVGANTFVTVPNLVPGKTDFFVVTAYNAAGVQSAPSNQVLLLANFLTGGAGSAIAATPFISYSGDFNGDGKQDILWRNVETGEVDIWYMDGSSVISKDRIATVNNDWIIAGIGDFTGSGKSDILWENSVDGTFGIWVMDGNSYMGYAFPFQGDEWSIAGIADLTHSGRAGLLWRNIVTGELVAWNSVAPLDFVSTRIGADGVDWNLVGTADLFGDGNPALIWRNLTTGEVVVWRLNNSAIVDQASLGIVPLNWTIAGFGDFNGDGRQDILLYNSSDGSAVAWLMNGFAVSATWINQTPISQDWQITATPNVVGNNFNSILWSNIQTGEQVIWIPAGSGFSQSSIGFSPLPGRSCNSTGEPQRVLG